MCLPPCAHDQLTAAKPVNSQLALDGEAQARALSDPDQEGWNLNSVVGRAFWLRVSVIRIKFREEILELSLGANTANLDGRARYHTKQSIRTSE
ncbi:hypothetical protein HO173_005212 [Letharia columbiana]|uniref:Uncharacterized protein n=1 Tax=Letharia columbiana TaxID=112416 RepID=A0A8H6L640_9LECA|nr:uncharacterized protein HO173_005212 [Letharia columbiana]KAF6236921.1 hypothetical protein HO173_005212 [Letharia columbiana]